MAFLLDPGIAAFSAMTPLTASKALGRSLLASSIRPPDFQYFATVWRFRP